MARAHIIRITGMLVRVGLNASVLGDAGKIDFEPESLAGGDQVGGAWYFEFGFIEFRGLFLLLRIRMLGLEDAQFA